MTQETPLRPQPRFPEPDTQPFWDATKDRKLTYQTCDSCGEVIFYPRGHCNACGELETTWHTSSGEGTVYTYSVIMQSRHPAFKDLGPY
ncbi:MAG: zinc ribbon domain-containing protein, partial [SAR202 cluster bacterium]|nr:zinc ribbon domain-containing protein [SAR202 cluster bacterium]